MGEMVTSVLENTYQLYDNNSDQGRDEQQQERENMASILYVVFCITLQDNNIYPKRVVVILQKLSCDNKRITCITNAVRFLLLVNQNTENLIED